MANMKAIRIHEFGGPEVLQYEDIPRPEPASGEVLVRVYAAGVNPVDWKMRQGGRERPLPMIPGWDLAGVVESVGEGVTDWKKGDEVYSRPDISRDGSYAEYIAVRASELARKPKSVDYINAAAIPLTSLTAWQSLFDVGGLRSGQKVLIHAAAGGVGHFAVQLAKWKGAYVIGTASEKNHKFLRSIGADETIDYEKTRFEDAVHDVDMVFDTIGGETQERSWRTLNKGGILVSIIRRPTEEEAARYGARQGYVFVQPNGEELTKIAELVDSGKVKPYVQTVLPLADAGRAQELSETRHTRGKIVLKVV
jgi:NADPH:quinone reductase-like Zn-dependent oxidoreductase